MAEWDIKRKTYNDMFDYTDTVQLWPSMNRLSFHIISDPGEVQHSLYMDISECRQFANYLLKACDKVDHINQIRKELRGNRKNLFVKDESE